MQELLKIYISYVQDDLNYAIDLYHILAEYGFQPWMIHEDVLPGEDIISSSRKAINNANIFLILISEQSTWGAGAYLNKKLDSEIEYLFKRQPEEYLIVPIRLDKILIPEKLSNFQFADFYTDENQATERLLEGINKFKNQPKEKSKHQPKNHDLNRRFKNFIVSEVEIENIRCFEKVSISFFSEANLVRWAMVLGDNAVGKSTLLRCIALGLCSESDAVALMKDVSGDFVRKGAQEGFIKIHLREDKKNKATEKIYDYNTY